jgi:hypothetical protein
MNNIQEFIVFDENSKNLQYEGYIIKNDRYSYDKQIYGEYKLYDINDIEKIKITLLANNYININFDMKEYVYKNIHKQIYQSKKEIKYYCQQDYFINKDFLFIKFIVNNIEPTQFPNLYKYEDINNVMIQEFSKNNFIIQIINNKSDNSKFWIKFIIKSQLYLNFTKEINRLKLL